MENGAANYYNWFDVLKSQNSKIAAVEVKSCYMNSTRLTMTGLGRLFSGEQMEFKGCPNSRPWAAESKVGDRGMPSSCVLEPLQKGQLIRDLFLLKDFCWPGSVGRKIKIEEGEL